MNGTHPKLVFHNSISAMQNTYTFPHKVKCGVTMWPKSSIHGYILKIIKSEHSSKYIFANLYGNSKHYSQKIEMTQIFILGKIDGGSIVCLPYVSVCLYVYCICTHARIPLAIKGNAVLTYDIT